MAQQKTRKFDEWTFVAESGRVKQEIRVTIEGPLMLIATMKDGTKLTGTNVDELKSTINAYIQGLNKLEWEKVLVVVTSDDPAYHHENNASINMTWGVGYRSKLKDGRYVWKREGDRIDWHHGIYAHGAGDDFKVIPYTEAGEIFLKGAIDSILSLGKRIHAFFQADTLELNIARSTGNMLGAAPQLSLLP